MKVQMEPGESSYAFASDAWQELDLAVCYLATTSAGIDSGLPRASAEHPREHLHQGPSRSAPA